MEKPGTISPEFASTNCNPSVGFSKRSFFSVRKASNDAQATKTSRHHETNLFRRASSALAHHRIHHLSDIREVSGSSRTGTLKKKLSALTLQTHVSALDLPTTPQPHPAIASDSEPSEVPTPSNAESVPAPTKSIGSRAASMLSLPARDVPERRSSASIFNQSVQGSRQASLQELPQWRIPPAASTGQVVPNRSRPSSPVKAAIDRGPRSSDALLPAHSRTIIRTTPPLDILDRSSVRNERLLMTVNLPSPLFVGGGTVEGQVCLNADFGSPARKAKQKPMLITRLSVDILGVEEVNDGRRWVFLSLGSELIDGGHPPPTSLVQSRRYQNGPELSWILKSGSAILPFSLNLPLSLGPPPYLSKQACIRYLLVPTAYIQVGGKRSIVRQTWNIQMLTVFDPEKALASLPSPLLAADTLAITQAPDVHSVKVTAGLHRQTWVNGGKIFVDVHIVNHTAKCIKKIEVQLEKTTLWYAHAAAGTAEKSASHLRLPKRTDIEIIATTPVKKSKSWQGVSAHSSEVRTCEIEVPRGHVTISTGRYFEVRFFVNVVVFATRFKTCSVQLPITLIHMNSLDILPNSLAQVAASIEAKRAKTVPVPSQGSMPKYYSGQAFAAPRKQSLERERGKDDITTGEMNTLKQAIDTSPRRFRSFNDRHQHRHHDGRAVLTNADENAPPRGSATAAAHHHHRHHASCYHCHLVYKEQGERPPTAASQQGPKLPRLQVSTSGLGFSESEFEVPGDSPPKKVMLSEQERKMINQARELKLQREYSQKRLRDGHDNFHSSHYKTLSSWHNVAGPTARGPRLSISSNLDGASRAPAKTVLAAQRPVRRESTRARLKTSPDGRIEAGGRKMMGHREMRSFDSAKGSGMRRPVFTEGDLGRVSSKRSTRVDSDDMF
jgi:hypothetical protein